MASSFLSRRQLAHAFPPQFSARLASAEPRVPLVLRPALPLQPQADRAIPQCWTLRRRNRTRPQAPDRTPAFPLPYLALKLEAPLLQQPLARMFPLPGSPTRQKDQSPLLSLPQRVRLRLFSLAPLRFQESKIPEELPQMQAALHSLPVSVPAWAVAEAPRQFQPPKRRKRAEICAAIP